MTTKEALIYLADLGYGIYNLERKELLLKDDDCDCHIRVSSDGDPCCEEEFLFSSTDTNKTVSVFFEYSDEDRKAAYVSWQKEIDEQIAREDAEIS